MRFRAEDGKFVESKRINMIITILREKGPKTARELGEIIGCGEKNIAFHILAYRKEKQGIRVSGFDMTSATRKSRIYALGTEPDMPFPQREFPSRLKARKYPGMTPEEICEAKALQALAAQIVPFRDEMIFRTAGRRP